MIERKPERERKSEMEREKRRSSVKKFPNNQVIILITNHIDLAARTTAKHTHKLTTKKEKKRAKEIELKTY